MPFTVCLGGEREVADEALEGALPVVGAQVSDQGAFVRARVVTQVTLVRGQSQVGPGVAWQVRNNYR